MTFADFRAHASSIFKELDILKVADNISLLNCLFVHDYFNGNLPKSFDNTFVKIQDIHSFATRSAINGSLVLPSLNSTRYGLKSINRLCINSWNSITKAQKTLDDNKLITNKDHIAIDLHNTPRTTLKKLISKLFLESY